MLFYFKYSKLSSTHRIKKQTKLIFIEFHYFTVKSVYKNLLHGIYILQYMHNTKVIRNSIPDTVYQT